MATREPALPRVIPARTHDGRLNDMLFSHEYLETIEDAMEPAALTMRMARLMAAGLEDESARDPEGQDKDDEQLLRQVLWASEISLRRAIKLHNDRLTPRDNVLTLTPKDGA